MVLLPTVREMTDEDKDQYKTNLETYLGKLNDETIKTPKSETLLYNKIAIKGDCYRIFRLQKIK